MADASHPETAYLVYHVEESTDGRQLQLVTRLYVRHRYTHPADHSTDEILAALSHPALGITAGHFVIYPVKGLLEVEVSLATEVTRVGDQHIAPKVPNPQESSTDVPF